MTTFDDREQAFEAKFAHDEEMKFRAAARGYKLFGLWAAAKMGLSGAEAESYAKDLVRSDLEVHGAELAVAKVAADLGHAADETTVRGQMAQCFARAKEQLASEH